jgi:hypothetical protein
MKTTKIAWPLLAAVFLMTAASHARAQTPTPPVPSDLNPPPLPPPPGDVTPPNLPREPGPAEPSHHREDLGGYGSVTYQLSFPFGSTYQYTGVVSWRGLGLDLQWMIHPHVAAGLLFAWNVFYVNTSQTISYRGVDITGNQDRSLNVFPLLVDVRYMWGEREETRPFVGLATGGYVMTQRLELGQSAAQTTTFNFALAPEIGVLHPIKDSGVALQLEARYNVAFAGGGLPLQNWLELNVGVAWGTAL